MTTLNRLSAVDIVNGIRGKKFKAADVARAAVEAAKSETRKLNSYLSVEDDLAASMAKKVDEKISSGQPLGRLAGVPVAIKDNMMIRGVKTTCASKTLEHYRAPYDASVVEKLRDEDAVFIGKTNMDEFAMGSSTEFSAFGPAKNPWNFDLVPGGSSGGSAATVASRSVPLALGSDTGGSIRQPASFCGVIGMKPTYGTVSRYGLVAFASSLDQIGPFARDPADAALLLSVLCGHDPKDSTSVENASMNFEAEVGKSVKGMRIGLPKEYFIDGMDDDVGKAVRAAAETLKECGAEPVDISLPQTDAAVAAYYVLAPSEASSNLARYDGMRYGLRTKEGKNLTEDYFNNRRAGFGIEVKRRIMIGTYALSAGYYDAYYSKAQKVRTLIKRDFENAFQSVDAILTPTAPTPPFKAGEKLGDPLQMYLSDVFSIPVNLAGLPAVSVPGGFSKTGLPIGVQFIGPAFGDATLVRIADAFLRETRFHEKAPNFNFDAGIKG